MNSSNLRKQEGSGFTGQNTPNLMQPMGLHLSVNKPAKTAHVSIDTAMMESAEMDETVPVRLATGTAEGVSPVD